MWTHADTLLTDADCMQKCGQMRTIKNVDSTATCSTKELYSMVYIGVLKVIFFLRCDPQVDTPTNSVT